MFQDPLYLAYILLVWTYTYLGVRALTPISMRYYSKGQKDDGYIIANSALIVSNAIGGSACILILLSHTSLLSWFLGPPDWVDSLIGILGSVVILVLTFSRTSRKHLQRDTEAVGKPLLN